ncbi:MAG: beta-galactosidase, partial [Acidimicrobiales bacterium]
NLTQVASEGVQQNAGIWTTLKTSPTTDNYTWSTASAHSWTSALIVLRPAAAGVPVTTPTPPTSTVAASLAGLNVNPSYRPWRWAGGPNPDSWWDPGTGLARIANEMPLIAQANAKQVRVEFPWTWIEPSKGVFDWSHSDAIVNTAARYGIQVEPILVFCPTWEGAPTCVPNPGDYSAFVAAVAHRYNGKIHAYDIWNEPNCCAGKYFAGSEANYVSDVLNPAFAAVKAVDPSASVLTEALGPDTAWIAGLKADGARFDIFSYHDYPADPATVNSDGWTVRNQLNADGYSAVPLWLDEFSTPENTTSDSTQQSWLTTVAAPGANPAVNIKWYNLTDDLIYCSATTVCSTNYYGLLQHDLTPKHGFSTFQSLA